jgi:quercetin dioxygenase-like cupin family protein
MRAISKLGTVAILSVSLNAFADAPGSVPAAPAAPAAAPASAPVRTILERHEQTGVAGKEIVLGTAFLPGGSVIDFHTHPGDEVGMVLKGPLVLRRKGEPDRVLKTGDTFFNARGVVHSVAAQPGSDATAVSTWIVDKGQPLATPAPK